MAARKPLTEDQLAKVLAVLPQCSRRDACLVRVGLNTGFRIHELLSLTVGQVWDGAHVRNRITITRRLLKGGHGVHRRSVTSRTVPLNAAARDAIARYLEERWYCQKAKPTHPLFLSRQLGVALSSWQANRIVKAVIARAGLAGAGPWGTHTLRKSFCRMVYKNSGHDIELCRVAMAHQSIATTQRYLSATQDEADAVILSIGTTNNLNAPFQHHIA